MKKYQIEIASEWLYFSLIAIVIQSILAGVIVDYVGKGTNNYGIR